MANPIQKNDLSEVLPAAREIAHAAEQLATLATAEQLSPEVLEHLAEHAGNLIRALAEFRAGCDQAIKQFAS